MAPPLINRPGPPKPPLQSKGRILGVKLLDEPGVDTFEVVNVAPGNAGTQDWYGYVAVLSITDYDPKVQSTIFYGNSLYMLNNSVGLWNSSEAFEIYMRMFKNRSKVWGELDQVPVSPFLRRMNLNPVPQDPPVAAGYLTLLGAGFNPLKGFWVEFQGNFFLNFPIFQPESGSNTNRAMNAQTNPLTATGFNVPPGFPSDKC